VKSGDPLSTIPKRLPPSFAGLHLRDEVKQEEERAIAHARQAGAEASVEALLLGLLPDFLLDLLPLHPERRIRQHVVEVFAGQTVGREGVAEDDVGDVLALDEHVGLADGVGLGVQLLAIHDETGVWVQAARCSPATLNMPPVPAVGS
jgi:hypothetical protein